MGVIIEGNNSVFIADLVLDVVSGDIWSKDDFEDSNEYDGDQMRVQVKLVIPTILCKPIQLKVEVPEIAIQQVTSTNITELSVPITIDNKPHEVKIKEEVVKGESSGILAWFKKNFFDEL